jgi:endonuclease/exonuclease/phosphatase family metal-dependent hydrolase
MKSSLKKIFCSALFFPVFLNYGNVFASDSLKIMTYNIQGMKPGTDPDTRLIHIIEKLKQLDPDIIGIQEINETLTDTLTNQAKLIADSLSKYFEIEYYYFYSSTHLSWNNAYREFVGIISKHPIEDAGFKQLPPGLFIRKCTWSYIDSPLGMINFFSTHLSFTDVEARISQVEEIIPFIEETTQNNPGTGAILVGDFNDEPNSEPIIMLTGTAGGKIFTDTYFKIHPFGNPGYTVDSGNPEKRIDYIFLKNDSRLTIEDSYVVMDEPYSGNLYCSDHLGVMTIFTEAPTDLKESQNTIEGFELYQNFPNPFSATGGNPSTTIKYSLPAAERNTVSLNGQKSPISFRGESIYNIKLIIYDVLGREVARLVDKQQSSGQFQVTWDTSSLPCGVYFYTLSTGNFLKTRKMLLLR